MKKEDEPQPINPEKREYIPLVLLPSLRDVRTIGAGRIGSHIAHDILEDPDIARVVTIGSAGVGKTMLLEELKQAVLQELRTGTGSITFTSATYEKVKEECEKEFGPSESRPVQNWGTREWSILNQKLAEKAEIPPISKGTREVKFVELTGIGATQPRDRGVSALKLIAQEDKRGNRQGSTLYLVLVPDLRVQQRAGELRKEILNSNDEDVQMVLEKYRIILTGSIMEDRLGYMIGRKVKDIVRKNADLQHMETINNEMLEEAEKLRGIKRKIEFSTNPFFTSKWSDLIPADPNALKQMRNMAFYLNTVADHIGQLSGSPENVYLVMNPLKEKGSIYWYIN
ncbi:hypothetical protein HYU45_03260 [Candidatus Daviesbacteria bacterium]|nr:hypothetical protein [Candidatus Daviesbacteria bacterium]